jgi:hypothetical protein
MVKASGLRAPSGHHYRDIYIARPTHHTVLTYRRVNRGTAARGPHLDSAFQTPDTLHNLEVCAARRGAIYPRTWWDQAKSIRIVTSWGPLCR